MDLCAKNLYFVASNALALLCIKSANRQPANNSHSLLNGEKKVAEAAASIINRLMSSEARKITPPTFTKLILCFKQRPASRGHSK